MGTGVLLTGFGGPDSLEAVRPFMCNLMGREPSEELVERVRRRYLAIGGSSPLGAIASEIAEGLSTALDELGSPMPVAVGMRYWEPYIVDALAHLESEGCERVITVSLSPFESKVAHGAYREAIDEAAKTLDGPEIIEAPLVSTFDAYTHFFAGSIAVSLTDMEPNEGAIIVFSAHSLPEADLIDDDPYVAGLRQVANAVAATLGLNEGHVSTFPMLNGIETFGSAEPPRAWYLAYQSKGNKPGAWLGPDLEEIISSVAGSQVKGLIVCPIGFMTDHMETLYDLDIVAAEKAYQADLEFVRCAVPNAHPSLLQEMAQRIAELA